MMKLLLSLTLTWVFSSTVPSSQSLNGLQCHFYNPITSQFDSPLYCMGAEDRCFQATVTDGTNTAPAFGCASQSICLAGTSLNNLPFMLLPQQPPPPKNNFCTNNYNCCPNYLTQPNHNCCPNNHHHPINYNCCPDNHNCFTNYYNCNLNNHSYCPNNHHHPINHNCFTNYYNCNPNNHHHPINHNCCTNNYNCSLNNHNC
ncbi:phospholipase A2 inhibitor and Ly6/PLAUR domain-containing protein-like protein [Lates japonicus]|uniref:Phospholipase A2 inhibitor and Ly6/PLAUR domain-containing protein-like protein n=1 Tax=Lates japonicus TaxID=270547 RepID=A0AAD3NIA7_LATJO|nr:phospholipase A2 inhibitor and Ly6/PLAUR domain-containing protein-like protein [Lates japonicus]